MHDTADGYCISWRRLKGFSSEQKPSPNFDKKSKTSAPTLRALAPFSSMQVYEPKAEHGSHARTPPPQQHARPQSERKNDKR